MNALDHVDAVINRGEFVAVVGASGSGSDSEQYETIKLEI